MKFFSRKKDKKNSIVPQQDNKYKINIIENLVCYCFRVDEDEIKRIITDYSCRTVEDVQRHCSACQGCGGCRFDIEELLTKGKK